VGKDFKDTEEFSERFTGYRILDISFCAINEAALMLKFQAFHVGIWPCSRSRKALS